ncbi:MAG: hypothetical protein HY884_00685 [Deltaproteobacteria bacterium]|nr:hypothetical protein [Deltaproteobacteria bacterium]
MLTNDKDILFYVNIVKFALSAGVYFAVVHYYRHQPKIEAGSWFEMTKLGYINSPKSGKTAAHLTIVFVVGIVILHVLF